MNPENAYHWLQPQDAGQAGDLRGRPGRGPAGHRPAGQDLGQVHRQRAALRAARPVDRRAPGAVRARGGQGRHVRPAVDAQGRRRRVMPRVVVTGGSLGGLTAALVLRDAGCDVTVFERSSAALQARGAGIAALEATAAVPDRAGRPAAADVLLVARAGSASSRRRQRPARAAAPLPVLLLEHHLPVAARPVRRRSATCSATRSRVQPDGDSVGSTLAGGQAAEADLLVCADGVSSHRPGPAAARGQAVLRGLRGLARHAAGAGAVAPPPASGSATRSPTRC